MPIMVRLTDHEIIRWDALVSIGIIVCVYAWDEAQFRILGTAREGVRVDILVTVRTGTKVEVKG